MAMESALIHLVRELGSARAPVRNSQGEYEREPEVGPWVPARVMIRGGASPKTRPGDSSGARVAGAYELLIGVADERGVAIAPPTASSTFETDCPVLSDPVIELNGEPELLNDGTDVIGWLAYGDIPLDRS